MVESGAWVEGRKMLFDTMKHISTLSTGSIVAMETLGRDIFANGARQLLPILSLICLIVAAATAPMVMSGISGAVSNPHGVTPAGVIRTTLGFFVCWIAFILGLVFFIVA